MIRKTSNMESLFRKTVTPEACNRTIDSVTCVFLWIYSCEYSFSFLLCLKIKPATGDVPWEKVFLKISQIYRKMPALGSLFNKIAGFRNTYFEERLWTTASKNITIWLTVKVLVLRGVKFSNSNLNKKKNICENLNSCDTRIVGNRRLF